MSETLSKNVTLVLTHQCNLRCPYCYEKHKDNESMSIERAKAILEQELTEDDGTTDVEIDFFGGEPLLEFDTIRAVVEYAKSRSYPKSYIFFITTNGTVLSASQKEWLLQNTDVLQIGLSLDGTKKMHDRNRCGSYDKIDIPFFRDNYPEQTVKMTVSRETLPDLAEGVLHCHSLGFRVSCNLAYGIDWSAEENARIFEKQLMKLIEYYLANPSVEPCSLLDINRIKSVANEQEERIRYCGAGTAMRTYDYDGTFYPCQYFLPFSVGKEKAEISLGLDFKSKFRPEDENPACRRCLICNVCPTCYGNNFALTGNIHKRDERMCHVVKIQFRAIAFFAAEKFRLGQLKDLRPEETAAILKSALLISQGLGEQ